MLFVSTATEFCNYYRYVVENDLYSCYETHRTSDGFIIMLVPPNVSHGKACNLLRLPDWRNPVTVFFAIRNDFTKRQIVIITIMPKTYVKKKVMKAAEKSHDCYCKNKVLDGIASSYFKWRNLGPFSKNLFVVPLSNLTTSGDETVVVRSPELWNTLPN